MRSPSDEAIDIVGLDVEIYIKSMDCSPIDVTAEDIGLHLFLYLRV